MIRALLLLALATSAAAAQAPQFSVRIAYNAVTDRPEYRSHVDLGVRWSPRLMGSVRGEFGVELRQERADPFSERLKWDGNTLRHWGVGVRVDVAQGVELLGSFSRTDRTYGCPACPDPNDPVTEGYYAGFAVGVDLTRGPMRLRVEVMPVIVRSWALGRKQVVARGSLGPVGVTAEYATPAADQDAGARAAVRAAVRLLGPLYIQGGSELLPALEQPGNPLVPVWAVTVGVQYP